jgi:hypothetical protein
VSPSEGKGAPSLLGICGVEHYWLCDRCSHVFTLALEENRGVVLKLLYPELWGAEEPKELTDLEVQTLSITTFRKFLKTIFFSIQFA